MAGCIQIKYRGIDKKREVGRGTQRGRNLRLGLIGVGINTRLPIEDNDAVRQIGCHGEVVLHDERCLLCVHNEAFNHPGSDDTLLTVEISAGPGRRYWVSASWSIGLYVDTYSSMR